MSQQKLGSIFDAINTAINAFNSALPLIVRQQQSGANTHVDVFGMIDNLVRQLNQLEVGFAALPANQRLQNGNTAIEACNQVLAALEQVPANTSSSAYLNSAKLAGQAVLAHIRQMIVEAQNGQTTTTQTLVNQTPITQTVPVLDGNGQVIYQQIPVIQQTSNQLIGGIDNTLLIGGVLLVVLLLK